MNVGLAFLAGILSFLSPCVLPLIPSYISIIAGASFQDLKNENKSQSILLINTLFFVIGFSILFIILGILSSIPFRLTGEITQIINSVAGIIVIILGLNFIFNFLKILNVEKRFHLSYRPKGKTGSFLLGIAFGAGWSPCVGPILASILLLAGTTGTLWQGAILLSMYSLGLGIPFILSGVFFTFALRQFERVKPHLETLKKGSGIFLVLIGILIMTGRLQRLNTFMAYLSHNLKAWEMSDPLGVRLLFSILFLALFLIGLIFYIVRIRKEINSTSGIPGQGESRNVYIKPVRLVFLVLFLAVSVLSATGTVNIANLFFSWLGYQGV